MPRKHFILPKEQIEWLKSESKDSGFSVSEIVRWILNKHIADTRYDKVSVSQSIRKGDK